jgi:hypothetical protein
MYIFVQPTPAPVPKSDNVKKVSLLLAAIFLLMAVAQLFSFEKFIPLLTSFNLPGGEFTAYMLASVIVVGEVAALPFLLRMELSPLMRFASTISSWIVLILWFVVQAGLNVSHSKAVNNGLFGASVHLPIGWWAVLFILALGVLAAWVSWGMGTIPRRFLPNVQSE